MNYNITQAVKESLENTYGYFYFDSTKKEVLFQPTLSREDLPDTSQWDSCLVYIGKPYEFANASERETDLVYLLEGIL